LFLRTLLALPQAGRQRRKHSEQFFRNRQRHPVDGLCPVFFIGAVIAFQAGPVLGGTYFYQRGRGVVGITSPRNSRR